MDIAQKVLQHIQDGDVKPLPKAYFVVRTVLVWGAVVCSVLLTGVAVGLVVYLLYGHEWGVTLVSSDAVSLRVFEALPYFWLALTVLLLCVAVLCSRHLKRGYSVRTRLYVGLYGVLAILIGVIVAGSGGGARIDHYAAQSVPQYSKLVTRPEDTWVQPERGMLAGRVVHYTGEQVMLEDCRSGHWILDVSKAEWRCGARPDFEGRLKFTGMPTTRGVFAVTQVLPWDITLSGVEKCIKNHVLDPTWP